MTDIGSIGARSVQTLGDRSVSNLEYTGSVQFMYAMLQMELAQSNKNAALDKIDGIKAAQEQSKAYTQQINQCRDLMLQMEDLQTELDEVGGNNGMSSLFSKSELDAEVETLTPIVEEVADLLAEAKDDNSNLVYTSWTAQDYINGLPSEVIFDMQRGGAGDHQHLNYEVQIGYDVLSKRLEVLQQAQSLYTKLESMCESAGITINGGAITLDSLKSAIANLEGEQETVSADIQQEMVFVQDFMGQYNAYTQGSSSAISEANETLKTLARG